MKRLRIYILFACFAFQGTSFAATYCVEIPSSKLKTGHISYDDGKSRKGHWSAEDKRNAMIEIAKVRSDIEKSLGDRTDAYIECYIERVEANYKNFEKANADIKGCTKLAEKCIKELNIR